MTNNTMRTVALNTTNKLYSLAVVREEDRSISALLAQNVTIDTICSIETYFDSSKLFDNEHLVRFLTDGCDHYFQDVTDGTYGEWTKMRFR